MTRAGFASKSLWVTEYSPEEKWVGGEYTLQNPHPGGILEWVKKVSSRELSESQTDKAILLCISFKA